MVNDSSSITGHFKKVLTTHYTALLLCVVLSAFLLIIAWPQQTLFHTTMYLIVMVGCFLISETIVYYRKLTFSPWQIKQPKKELLIILFTVGMATLLLFIRFVLISDFQAIAPPIKIVLFAFVALFIYPVFLAIYFFGIGKYKPSALGLNSSGWWVALPLIALIGGISVWLLPDELMFSMILEQQGYLAMITMGFMTAAIPEEFTRMLFQTRLGKVMGNKSAAWFIASLIWALTHIPNFYSKSDRFYGACIGAIGIMPIGLLWGYLTERYKSMIPAILIHGTNLWGLHNIF